VKLHADPYCFLRPVVRRSYGFVSAADPVTDNTEEPGAGALTLAGVAPSRFLNHIRNVAAGAIVAAGIAASALVNHIATPPAGSLAFGTNQTVPIARVSPSTAPTTGTMAVEGLAPTVSISPAVATSAGSMVFEGQAPTLAQSPVAHPGVGTLALEGLAPYPLAPITVRPGAGALAITGETPTLAGLTARLYDGNTLVATRSIDATASFVTYEFALTAGEAASIDHWSSLRVSLVASGNRAVVSWVELEAPEASTNQTVEPTVGALAFSGVAPTEYHDHTIEPAAGSMALAAPRRFTLELYDSSTLVATREVELVEDAYAIYSFDLTTAERNAVTNWDNLSVSLVADGDRARVAWVGVSAPDWGVSPTAGTLTFAGVLPTIAKDGQIQTDVGTMAVAGLAPTITVARIAKPAAGALTLTGLDVVAEASPSAARRPANGTLTLAGVAPSVKRNYLVAPTVGTLTFTGERAGRYPRALFWMDATVVAAGMEVGSIVEAGANAVSLVAAGIAAEVLEYES
jgi:hypothetical protein